MIRRLVLAKRTQLAVQKVLKLKTPLDVSFVVVGDVRMRKLNQRYRQVDQVTDVLSFTYAPQVGEVVLCYPQAKRQAISKQHSLQHELAWLMIHGILHILGYDHEQAADAKIMRPLEQRILRYV